MSNLDICMSNLTLLFEIFSSNFLTNGSTKIPKKHPKSYTQSWIFGSFGFPRFQYHLGHTYVQPGHTYVQAGHTCVQVGHTCVRSNNPSTEEWKNLLNISKEKVGGDTRILTFLIKLVFRQFAFLIANVEKFSSTIEINKG